MISSGSRSKMGHLIAKSYLRSFRLSESVAMGGKLFTTRCLQLTLAGLIKEISLARLCTLAMDKRYPQPL